MSSIVFWSIVAVIMAIAVCLAVARKKRSQLYEKCEAKRFKIGNRISKLRGKSLTHTIKYRLDTLQERLNKRCNYTRTTVEEQDYHILDLIESDLATTEAFAGVSASKYSSPAPVASSNDWHTTTQVKRASSYDHDYSSSSSSGSSYSDSSSCSSSDSGSSGGCGGGGD